MKTTRFDLWPSVTEVFESNTVFMEYIQSQVALTKLPTQHPNHVSEAALLECAVAEVWRAARLYQRDRVRGARVTICAGLPE